MSDSLAKHCKFNFKQSNIGHRIQKHYVNFEILHIMIGESRIYRIETILKS